MEDLFSNNLFAIYIIACIAIISYTNFQENQRMFILYLFTYATAIFEVFRISYSLALLLIITFVFLEYLTEDSKKIMLFTKSIYKILDYAYMMFFQYYFHLVIISFTMLYFSRQGNIPFSEQILYKSISIISLILGSNLTISQPFKIKQISDLFDIFEKTPPHLFTYKENMQKKFDLLCAIEDKSFFARKNSYSCISLEYISWFVNKYNLTFKEIALKTCSLLFNHKNALKFCNNNLNRGYSTPEMQLLRTVGINRGYDKYKIRRKIYEIIYSKLFFSSYKEYHKANTYLLLTHYRHYILYVYFRTVLTKINGYKCTPLSSAFHNSDDLGNWSMNGLFVACLGLSFRPISNKQLENYTDIIENFNLDKDIIKTLSDNYPKPF